MNYYIRIPYSLKDVVGLIFRMQASDLLTFCSLNFSNSLDVPLLHCILILISLVDFFGLPFKLGPSKMSMPRHFLSSYAKSAYTCNAVCTSTCMNLQSCAHYSLQIMSEMSDELWKSGKCFTGAATTDSNTNGKKRSHIHVLVYINVICKHLQCHQQW